MSTPAFDHRRSLQLLRLEVTDLSRRIALLSPKQWQQEKQLRWLARG